MLMLGIIKLVIYYDQNKEHVLKVLHASEDGLTTEQATQRLHQYGYNLLTVKGESLFKKIIEPFKSVFVLILAIAAGLSLLKGEYIDAGIIIAIITISAIIYYVQRASTDRVLKALKQHDKAEINVWRDGQMVVLDTEILVPGDVFEISEGEKVPADARVLHADNGRVDEALLTGESEPVAKHPNPLSGVKPIYEQTNILFQGSFIVGGTVKAVVIETGNSTEFGKLAQLAGSSQLESPVQKKIDKLITYIVVAVSITAVLFLLLSLARGQEFSESLRFMLALLVSAVPEGLPIALSVVLVLGMQRMAKKNALVRNMSAIENIGLVTLIASDKTGTLTKNQLKVQDVWEEKPNSDLHDIAVVVDRTIAQTESGKLFDPLDEAFKEFATEYKVEKSETDHNIQPLPFDQKYAMSGAVWQTKGSKLYDVFIKGAPEKVLHASSLTKKQIQVAELELHRLTGQGLRVIAVAKGKYKHDVTNIEEVLRHKLDFIALIAVADELREEAPGAIKLARRAGVSVVMITGDHAETAYAIGKKIGLVEHREDVFDSRILDEHKDHDSLAHHIHSAKVFARVTPENKFKILTILKKQHITAMTGDGVNDVPALAQSHIGIAMGSGTQIAKESGDIVLLDNNFSTIVEALKEGRIIFANIRRMLFYLLATSSGEILTMLGALIIGLPLPVLAVQLLWINLVTDTALVIPLGLEPAEEDVMDKPPRKPNDPILDNYLIFRMLLVAATMAVVTLIIFNYFLGHYSEEYARTIAFTTLVVMQWANAFNARSDKYSAFGRLLVVNTKFAVGLTIAVVLQLLVLFGPLQSVLKLTAVDTAQVFAASAIGGLAVITVSELHKLHMRRFAKED